MLYSPGLNFALPWLAVLIAGVCIAQAPAAPVYPTTIEIDLVFPRNETYAPTFLLPVVFAVRNPQATVGLLLRASMGLYNGTVRGDPFEDGFKDIAWLSNSANGDEPYFILFGTIKLKDAEGSFALQWEFMFSNCSATEVKDDPPHNPIANISSIRNTSIFTLRKGAKQPSLTTTPDSCPISVGTFNITNTVKVNDIEWERPVCAVLAFPPPTPSPCTFSINSTFASNISAMITASACNVPTPPAELGCPDPKKSNSAAHSGLGWVAWSGVGTGLLLGMAFMYLQQ